MTRTAQRWQSYWAKMFKNEGIDVLGTSVLEYSKSEDENYIPGDEVSSA